MTATSPFLGHLNHALIEEAYRAGAGNELDSGKLLNPESSAALVANTFDTLCCRALMKVRAPRAFQIARSAAVQVRSHLTRWAP